MYGGKFAFHKTIGLACSGKEIYTIFALFCFFSEGRFNGGFFGLRFWGAYIWRGLYMEGLIFGILRYLLLSSKITVSYHTNISLIALYQT